MRINDSECVACLECIDYCPVSAIKQDVATGRVLIDEDECVECSGCLRAGVCPCDAIWQPELKWPRILRAEFSNPVHVHPSTGLKGRGTEEVKTNDIRGTYTRGRVGIAVELGRPGVGARFRDVEKVAMAMAPLGITFARDNPFFSLVTDPATGKMNNEVLDEKVLSVIVEFSTTPDMVPPVLKKLREVSQQVDTVFSVDMCSLLDGDGTCPAEEFALNTGVEIRPNGKDNIGLGRPLKQF